ncbi:MAG: C10 family peptidase [Muribaculaceae bacterium]|nr:C10 family peptidase [Muribaculaceae bacterium]
MKQIITNLVLMALLLTGCTSEPEPIMPVNQQDFSKSRIRSKEEATTLACSIKSQFMSDKSRASVRVESVDAILSNQSRSGLSDTLIYVVNFADNQGYALISAPRCVEPILAVTESGSLNDSKSDIGVAQYVSAAKEYIGGKINLDSLTTPVIPSVPKQYSEWITDTLIYREIPTKIDMKWGQESIYGKYCPKSLDWPYEGVTGCGPTAIAMVMSYFEYPQSIVKSFDGSNETINLNWTEIKKHSILCQNCHINYLGERICYATKDAHDQIGLLMREIGERAGALYNKPYYTTENGETVVHYGTSTTVNGNRSALSYYGFNTTLYQNYSRAISNFDESNVMIVFGTAHVFIVDGIYRLRSQITERIWEEFKIKPISEEIISTTDIDLVHVNWGYDGRHNGMYNNGVFDMANCKKLDDPKDQMDVLKSYTFDCCLLVSR